jgi:hypothetical protein
MSKHHKEYDQDKSGPNASDGPEDEPRVTRQQFQQMSADKLSGLLLEAADNNHQDGDHEYGRLLAEAARRLTARWTAADQKYIAWRSQQKEAGR